MTIRRLMQTLSAVLTVLAVVIAALVLYARARRRDLVELQQQRFTSYQLAEELRNSSDELTRFARTYVATGDPRYERFYNDVLGIRAGELPRPGRYDRIYWDLAIVGDSVGASGPPVALRTLMEGAGFTPAEVAMMGRALDASNALVAIEAAAFRVLRGETIDAAGAVRRTARPDPARALRMLFDSTYHREKARIMAPIDSFLESVEARSAGDLADFDAESTSVVIVIWAIVGAFVLTSLLAYPVLRARVLVPVRRLTRHTRMVAADIERLAVVSAGIAKGDLTQAFEARTSPMRSLQHDEIGDLSVLQDEMLGQLQTTGSAIASMTEGLRRANQVLETHVADIDREREYLETILDSAPVAVGVTVNGICRYANPRFSELGVRVGEQVTDFYESSGDREEIDREMRERGAVRNRVVRFRLRDGRRIDGLSSFHLIRFAGEDAIVGWIVDVTQLKQIEEALRDSMRAANAATVAKGRFLAHMSHEIRTPLNAVLGYAQLLQTDGELQGAQRRKVNAIRSSGDHLLGLLNDILEMSRLEAGRTTLSREPFDLYTLIDGLRSMFTELASQRGIQLVVEVSPTLARGLLGDAGKIRQVLINLLGNALKFTPHGTVSLRMSSRAMGPDECEVSAEVEDTGPGISAEDQAMIFTPFGQAEAGRQKSGTGLGLSISRSFANLMGGDITVTSEAGKGATFRFTFTAAVAEANAAVPAESRDRSMRLDDAETRRKVLVVDDVASNRELLEEQLTRAGFLVRLAESGEKALEMHASWEPDLVLMDLHMPGMGGLSAIRHLREVESRATIVVTTAAAGGSTKREAEEAGANGLVNKPYRESELFDTIARTLGTKFIELPDVTLVTELPSAQGPRIDVHFKGLPADLVAELRDACLKARAPLLLKLAVRVAPHSEPAARVIRDLANGFHYRALLDALDEA